MSWKVEVQVGGRKDWNGNAMRYTTKPLAEREAQSLMNRWLLVDEWRVVESEEPANYGADHHGMIKPVAEIAGIAQTAAEASGDRDAR